VTTEKRRLEAPHRRPESTPPRIVEKAAVVGYRGTSALLAVVPPRVSETVLGAATRASYLAWPAKRRSSNLNFSRVLGLPADDPRVRRLALRAYREYARYIVELMRLPSRPTEELVGRVEEAGIDRADAMWRQSGRPIIIAIGHVGSNEAVGAALAGRGWPISVVADDSTFPELYDLLRRQREAWGIRLIPWRNLRELFGVLRRNEVLILLVDWGYRDDGIPVKLFDHWTTLPAGPATLAAKTGADIAWLAVRRTGDGGYRIELDEPFGVPSSDPADLQRATQRIADGLERTIAAAPEQWYSFKPVWPHDPTEVRMLEARAAEMLAGDAAAEPGRSAPVPRGGPAPGGATGA
jgi:KDO2-lipid IV(A) lauroyltransferase